MSAISLLLRNVHANEYVFSLNLNYTEPKIYTGGIDIDDWPKPTKKVKGRQYKKTLSIWYVLFLLRKTRKRAGN
jgi:hypothetical protein